MAHNNNPLENFDTLANGMAHAIRNPLSSILTASSLVSEDPNVSEETRMLLDVIVRESQHLNRIFTDFLEYVRPVSLAPERIDLRELVQRTAAQLQREGILKEVEFDFTETLEIWADENSITGALRQIMLNAGEAMSQKGAELETKTAFGKLRVTGFTDDDQVVLLVEDSGPGLSARQLERGFEPFFSDTADGTGLGLPLACAAIIGAGGTVNLENRPDARGARVTVTFPKAQH
jgi:nitrogen fixation/metabolism regulation signal transduction histidine kinase